MTNSHHHQFGWIDWPEQVEQVVSQLPLPSFAAAATSSGIVGSGAGKVMLLHEILTKVAGHFPIHEQTIGDCVSHGWGLAVDVLAAVEISKGENEQWVAETATEPLYGASRVEIGGGRLGNGDGSLGGWAADAVRKYGTLIRKKYDGHDYTRYSGQVAKSLGVRGIPDELEPESRQHIVETTSLVRSYEEARDAIYNGYPVPVCSNQGFASTRDNDGFSRPEGSWAHCMLFVSMDDEHRRPGLLCMNSWGPNWIRGPKRHNQPDGSFWVDAATCTKMLRGGDSFSVSQFNGYPAQKLDWMMI